MTIQVEVRNPPLDGLISHGLTGSEQHAVRQLAAELTQDPTALIDSPEWIDRARELSSRLPLGLRTALRRFRRHAGPEGVLVLRGLPVDQHTLPATPAIGGSAQHRPTTSAAVLVLTTLQIGEVVAFRPEKGGALVQDVVPVPGQEDFQGNAGSVTLKMHNENAFHPHRPDYVALLCLRNDHDNQAGLRTSCVRQAVELLGSHTRQILGQPRFVTNPPPSFGETANGLGPRAVLGGDPDDPDVQVDFNATDPLDIEAATALDALGRAFDQVRRTFVLQPGELAIVDNRLALHGRTAFRPRYDGQDRWLQRVYIQLDPRRSRAARPADGNVLD